MRTVRLAVGILIAVGLASGCVTPDRPPLPPARPLSGGEVASLYTDAIELSSQAAASHGYSTTMQLMEQLRPNYWRVRFAAPEKGSGKVLDVYFDGTRREVVETKEIDITPVPQPR